MKGSRGGCSLGSEGGVARGKGGGFEGLHHDGHGELFKSLKQISDIM